MLQIKQWGALTRLLAGCVVLTGMGFTSVGSQAAPLFQSDDTLRITIEAPLGVLFGQMLNADVYVEAQLTLEGQDAVKVRIKPRGKTRRREDICNFPPLTVNFKKGDMAETAFAGQKKLKLVTHCQDRVERYQTYYRQEYHIYRTYNLLTDESFRVRPATITYIDTGGKRKTITRFAFFIEDADDVAKRNGMKRHKVEKVDRQTLDSVASSRFAIFQYMIANLDWATTGGPAGGNCCHNSKPLVNDAGVVIPVPYDFDFSGVINAKYASPPQGIKATSVRKRIYRGLCQHNETVPAAIGLLNDKRGAISELYLASLFLTPKEAGRALKFYDAFFKIVNNPRDLERKIIRRCRG